MSPSSYFSTESLRRRFSRHVHDARLAGRIDASEQQWLLRLDEPDFLAGQPTLYSLILEDGSPVAIGLASALLIVGRHGPQEVLYLDTLSHGLERFSSRAALLLRLRQLFSVRPDLDPQFEYQLLQGAVLRQRSAGLLDCQVQALLRLADELDKLPTLDEVVAAVLASRAERVWPGAGIDLRMPVVQVLHSDKDPAGGGTERVLRVEAPLRMALDTLVGDLLPAGQFQRVLGQQGEALKAVSDALFIMVPGDLRSDCEQRLAAYWSTPDAHGLSRRDRTAQAIANGFADQAWRWQAQRPGQPASEGLGQLAGLPLSSLPALPIRRLSVSSGEQQPVKLVSLYWIEAAPGSHVLYSPLKGLRPVADWHSLEALFNSPAGRLELSHYLSADDQPLLTDGGPLKLLGYPLAGPLFGDCIDAIIAAQKRNVSEALRHSCNDLDQWRAMLDDALDVRALIDPRLPACQSGARWPAQPQPFKVRRAQEPTPPADGRDDQVLSWMEQLTLLDSLLATLNSLRPGLQALAGKALAPWLAVLGHPQPALTARVCRADCAGANSEDNRLSPLPGAPDVAGTARPRWQALTDLLLERHTGLQPGAAATGSPVLLSVAGDSGLADAVDIEAEVLEHLLQQASIRLDALCAADLAGFYRQPQRIAGGTCLAAPILYAMRESLLRLELEVMRHLQRFATVHGSMLQQVLERPTRALRLACGEQLTEVQALRLNVDGRELPLPLHAAWVMQQPALTGHGVLFWSALTGVVALQSPAGVVQRLSQSLSLPRQRAQWLGLFAEQDRQWLDQRFAQALPPTVTLSLATIEGHFLKQMLEHEQQLQQEAVDRQRRQARQAGMAATSFTRHFDLAGSLEGQLLWLDALATRIQNMLFVAVLPDWLGKAGDADLGLYSQLLSAYYRHGDPDDDFLADIPPLRVFAREQVLEALRRDFPDQALEPLQITLSMTRYVAAPVAPGSIPSSVPAATLVTRESLVGFALNHFSRIQDGSLSVSLPAGVVPPPGLTAQYLMTLVHALDVGQRYQALLAGCFDPGRADFAVRRQRFMQQIPARLLLPALEMKLQGQLSQTAFDYLHCVMDMPDGKARQPVHGQDIVVRPLTLRPRQDMQPDSVEGLFLIGPRDLSQGPVILHTLFNDWFSLKEYRNRDDLLTHMQAQTPLQTLVLDRVSPLLRKRYANGGLIEAHIPWSTEGFLDVPLDPPERVTLGTETIEGNVLRHLFGATLQLLQHLSGKQSVSSAEADWASFVHVVTLGAEQVLSFLPGKLGFLVAAWQSRSLLQESASAVSEQRWGKALSEFSAALGMLVVARREQGELARGRSPGHLPVFSWRQSALTQDIAARLRRYEVQDIELASLEYDELYNLYLQPGTRNRYAAVEGKVYAVRLRDGVWRITGRHGDGPPIRLNQSQQWELHLEPGLRGGGLLPPHIEQAMQLKVEQYMNVQARGMAQIRAYSREQARQIGSARHRALGYLETALFNLNAPFAEGLVLPVRSVLNEFFGVQAPDPVLIDSLRHRLNELYDSFAEPSLSVLDSGRFVTGLVKPGHEDLAAFVINSDPQQRIYLGDLFFTPPLHMLRQDNHYRAFDADDHFRAMALLHEMSHLVCQTRDIAYLDASAPPGDLLDDNVPGTASYKQELQHLRDHALSHRTPGNELFRTRDNAAWRDFNETDGQVFHSLLRLSGQPTLDSARQAFLNDPQVRRRIILSNADSLAMLVALLGRERFTASDM